MPKNTSHPPTLARAALLTTTAAVLALSPTIADARTTTPAAVGRDASSQVGAPAGERQQIVDRAVSALATPKKFRLTRGGTIYTSTPASGYNYLGRGGSNANLNVYNGYRGLPWCGHFAAAMWKHRNVPRNYWSSQAWRTGLGDRFHAYSPNRLPQPGDVLVWTNNGDSAHGHVGVVVAVAGRTVTTIEGNVNPYRDSIARKSYQWTGSGPAMSGKTFRGFASHP
ncbi:CHAP domain-containing protein [Streptomyces sp. NBC_00258]|uniref:CHAP domain-containing protein n=1 Tax=Streptomyces sp. NBC_00258 TaxID=2903642 RepID=UPI002E2DB200|nr:CHAP domain-containing protein [Streptomyces sp. NBC_00258]